MKTSSPYYRQSRPEMVPFLPETAAKVLDVGCGEGSFGSTLKNVYPIAEIFGIEIDPEAVLEARKIYDQVWEGDVCEILSQRKGTLFDLIVFNDILEHVVDPWECLRLTRDLLQPDGSVVASIPNMRFWPILSDLVFRGNWNYRDAGVMDRTHLRFFTRNSIEDLFSQTGFRVNRIRGINQTWNKSWRWRAVNTVFPGRFHDCLFPQFAVAATLAGIPQSHRS